MPVRNVFLLKLHSSSISTFQKAIATCSRVRQHTGKLASTIENDPIRTWASASIEDLSAGQDWELVPRTRTLKIETFVVVVAVRIIVGADSISALLEVTSSTSSFGDGAGGIDAAAAGCAPGLALVDVLLEIREGMNS